LVLYQPFDDRTLEAGRKYIRILVDGAEAVLEAIVPEEAQRLGLETAARRSWSQSATCRLQVED